MLKPGCIAVTLRRLASTFNAEPVVWAKIKSNGHLPETPLLKEVLFSLLAEGIAEIKSPERCWGLPLPRLRKDNDLSRIFGGPMPVMHIHANKEEAIVQALLDMEADYRIFGREKMVSGIIDLRKVSNPLVSLGKKPLNPTEVQRIDADHEAFKPHFDLISANAVGQNFVPSRPESHSDNDNLESLQVA